MNAPVKVIPARTPAQHDAHPVEVHIVEAKKPAPAPKPRDPTDPEAMRREALLEKLRDDRADMVKVATVVRELAQTVEVAQNTLALTRRSLRWLLLAGSAAALTVWLTNGRRPHRALFAGLSMQALHRLLRPGRDRVPAPAALPAPRTRAA